MASRSSAHCAAEQTTNAIKSTVNRIPWTSTHAGMMLGEHALWLFCFFFACLGGLRLFVH